MPFPRQKYTAIPRNTGIYNILLQKTEACCMLSKYFSTALLVETASLRR